MKQIKLPSELNKTLSTYGVPSKSISLVEEYYSGVIHEVAKENSQASKKATKPKDKEREFRSTTREMAEKSRIVK